MGTDIDTIYIGGEWVTPSSTNKIGIQSPATGEPVGSVIAAGERDVDRAVAAARAAFDDPGGWSNWEPADRAAALAEFARQYELVAEDMVHTVCQQNGMPISQAAQLEGAVPACYSPTTPISSRSFRAVRPDRARRVPQPLSHTSRLASARRSFRGMFRRHSQRSSTPAVHVLIHHREKRCRIRRSTHTGR